MQAWLQPPGAWANRAHIFGQESDATSLHWWRTGLRHDSGRDSDSTILADSRAHGLQLTRTTFVVRLKLGYYNPSLPRCNIAPSEGGVLRLPTHHWVFLSPYIESRDFQQ